MFHPENKISLASVKVKHILECGAVMHRSQFMPKYFSGNRLQTGYLSGCFSAYHVIDLGKIESGALLPRTPN